MKKTKSFLLTMLACVCLACAAVGLVACGGDPEPVDKLTLGDNYVGDLTKDAKELTLDVPSGDKGYTDYTLTAKVNGNVTKDVYMFISAGYKDYGTLDFTKVGSEQLKVKLSAAGAADTVKGVTVTVAETVYPAGHIRNPNSLALDTAVNYTATGTDYVWFKVDLTEAGSYLVTFTADETDPVVLKVGTLNGDRDGLLDYGNDVSLIPSYDENDYEIVVGQEGVVMLAPDTYYFGVGSDKENNDHTYATVTGSMKLTLTTKYDNYVSLGHETTLKTLKGGNGEDSGATVAVIGEAGKNYVLTAYVGDSLVASEDVILAWSNPGKYVFAYNARTTTVEVSCTEDLSNVRLVLTEWVYEDGIKVDLNSPISIGDWDMDIRQVTITDSSNYKFAVELPTGVTDSFVFVKPDEYSVSDWTIASAVSLSMWGEADLDEDTVIPDDGIVVSGDGTYATIYLSTGTYYFTVGKECTLTITKA